MRIARQYGYDLDHPVIQAILVDVFDYYRSMMSQGVVVRNANGLMFKLLRNEANKLADLPKPQEEAPDLFHVQEWDEWTSRGKPSSATSLKR